MCIRDRLYVGLLAALPPAGMMISSFLSPALCRRVEMGVLLSGSLILLALATIASCMTTDMTLLLLPRLLTGLASGVIIVLGESWITGGAAGSQRATPVSYTHLDVYKRQPLNLSAWLAISFASAVCESGTSFCGISRLL